MTYQLGQRAGNGIFRCHADDQIGSAHSSPTPPILPLPDFSDPWQAQYSVILNAYYLPLQMPYVRPDFIIGEIPTKQAPTLLYKSYHEQLHKVASASPLKQRIRLLAAKSYLELWRILMNDNIEESWRSLLKYNRIIDDLTKTAELSEELFVNAATFYLLRSDTERLEGENDFNVDIDALERLAVQICSQPSILGDTFRDCYAVASRILHRYGSLPLYLLLFYVQGILEVEIMSEYTNRYIIRDGAHENLSRSLLMKWLDVLDAVPPGLSLEETRSWFELFHRLVPEFEDQKRNIVTSSDDMEAESLNLTRLVEKTIEPEHNPLNSLFSVAHMGNNRFLTINPKTIRTVSFIGDRVFMWIYNDQVREAKARNNSVVLILPDRGRFTVSLVPSFNESGEYIGAEYVPLFRDRNDPSYESLLTRIGTLTFYEGLRQMVSQGTGLKCPIMGDAADGCCGAISNLCHLYESGRVAMRSGLIPLRRWEDPSQYPPCSSASS